MVKENFFGSDPAKDRARKHLHVNQKVNHIAQRTFILMALFFKYLGMQCTYANRTLFVVCTKNNI